MHIQSLCLVFDAESQFDGGLLRELRDAGCEVRQCSQIEACSEAASLVVVVQSCRSPVESWHAVRRFEARFPRIPVLLASRAGSGQWLLAAAQFGQIRPLRRETLSALVANEPEERPLFQMIGDSQAMARARDCIARIAGSDANVLLTGESGTGKELAAEMIHHASPRANGPFVPVNCAAIPDSLLESELFGYQKGAFTGASGSRVGRFGEADGGTLFLDEIGEMNSYAQAKILRAIETRRIDRLGGRSGERVDIRCIAATNRNLEEMVAGGKFRQDLYFRLNVVEICLPPLRERSEDIPALVEHYIRVLNKRFGVPVERLSDEMMDLLKAYAWPGNIRELRNLLESIYAHRPPAVVSIADLPDSFRRRMNVKAAGEKERLLAALDAVNWNKSAAAKDLRWSRVTLYRKLVRYNLMSKQRGAPEPEPKRFSQAAG